MATTKNIQMQVFNGTDYDTLYPKVNLANSIGVAPSATKLETAKTIRTNLASTSAASFDGTTNITPGVTGILPVANGGTGVNSLDTLKNNLGVFNELEAGSYVGIGKTSDTNQTVLNFNKVVQYGVFIVGYKGAYGFIPINGSGYSTEGTQSGPVDLIVTWSSDKKSVSYYYSNGNQSRSLSYLNQTYIYIAL